MTEFRSYRVEAVVIRHSDVGEADRLLTVYTRQHGKLRAIAKGVRKVTSRKAGHLEPFTHVSLQLAKSHELPIVTQAETLHGFLPIREDILRTGHASYLLELVDRFTTIGESENSSTFNLILESLSRLASGTEPWLVLRYYEIRLLELLGYRPLLFECANCGNEIKPESQFFSYHAGGVICPRCGTGLAHLIPTSMDALKHLRHLQRSNFREAGHSQPGLEIRRETESLMQGFITFLLERELNSPEFLSKIRASQ
jgi:DNA repair protein RecO (recombination protein O)